jgi:anti-sigma regulatory factor (Ser/Thr protein kinase)
MDKGHHRHFSAQERSYLAVLKKDVHAMAAEVGFSDARLADIDIVVAEITSNLIKHAKDGQLLVRASEEGLELIGIDSGPGMGDVKRMAKDGMSTTNTLGHGLGAIERLSHECDMYSIRGWGTLTVSRFYVEDRPVVVRKQPAELHSIVVAKPGQTACGDGIAILQTTEYLKVLVGDGLGHGPEAQAVVTKAEASFMDSGDELQPVTLIRRMHEKVKRSRGLVAMAAVYNFKARRWTLCGVGNITAWAGNVQHNRNVLSYNGIVGLNIPHSLNEHQVLPEHGHLLILSSDGFRNHWDLQKYPGILKHDLSILAAALYKDYARQTDDMSILIARINQQ